MLVSVKVLHMTPEQRKEFKTLWRTLEFLDNKAREAQANQGNKYHAMGADFKSLNILVAQAYNLVHSGASLSVDDAVLGLLRLKVKYASMVLLEE